MTGYTTREVAEALGLTPRQVRSYASSDLLDPARGPGKEYRFTFQDIILLRTARELREGNVSGRRIRSALLRLREQLPEGRPLTAVHVSAQGDRVVVRDRETVWEPTTGQVTLDFSVEELASRVEPFARRFAGEEGRTVGLDADGWYDLGLDLEAVSAAEAMAAYERALALEPEHAEAHLNLGRLLHESGELPRAQAHYGRAMEAAEGPTTRALAAYNLGVVLEDRGRRKLAMDAYRRALQADPELPGAHFNLSRLYEAAGDAEGALRHLSAYRRLAGPSG